MDQTELQQKIAEYYQKLPQEAQEVFSSMQWLETLKQIEIKYNLNDQQIETLGIETTLVLLGIIHLEEYEDILKNEIKISEDSMDKMLIELDESILKSIRPQLTETFYKNNDEEKQKLDKKFNDLPEKTKNAIEKSNYQTKIYEIGKKYNLTISQMGTLGESVINVMLGKVSSVNFEESLKDLQLPTEQISEIVNDTNEQIFKTIREELVKNMERKSIPEKEESETETLKTSFPSDKSFESREELLKTIENPDLLKQKELPAPTKEELEEMLKNRVEKNEAPQESSTSNGTNSILSQKLSGSFKIPTTETEHTINNMTKGSGETKRSIPKVDPYREIPE